MMQVHERIWLLRTAINTWEALTSAPVEGDPDPVRRAAQYMTDVREVHGRAVFMNWLRANDDFGLSTYKRQKIMRGISK